MPETTPISAEQLKRLQTLYSQFAAAAGDPRVRSREERLMWVSFLIGHQVASFSDLTGEEAATAIARLQKDIPARKRRPRQPMDRERAERHGKDGRYDGEQFRNAPKLAEAYDLEQIEGYYHRLGWSRDTFDAWLRSPRFFFFWFG